MMTTMTRVLSTQRMLAQTTQLGLLLKESRRIRRSFRADLSALLLEPLLRQVLLALLLPWGRSIMQLHLLLDASPSSVRHATAQASAQAEAQAHSQILLNPLLQRRGP